MKRLHVVALVVAMAALLAFPAQAFAEHLSGADGWTVTFTQNEEMEDNYSAEQWADDVRGLQPGDDITFTVNLKHEHSTSADWYIANDVIKSLEEGNAQGSAYGYVLTYNGPSGTQVLFDSNVVGGDDTKGLKEATSGLKDFLFLDTLKQGQTATVTLVVTLDGETEQNAYFDTLAQLKMKFAVELDSTQPGTSTKTTTTSSPRTGDDTDLFPFYVAMAVSGLLLLCIGIGSVARRRREDGRGAR